ncbi:MAG: OprD family outer membrane porin [Candidatus Eremiobacteraeota bacterium]|nr:OprD family outer membrane porin [Candidatus Eremiobacteraeota bacterium]
MQKILTRVLLACALIGASAGAALAQASPSPAPETTAQPPTAATPAPTPNASATPNPFAYSGYIRSFYFTRTNASNFPQASKQINQASFNTAINLHGQYTFAGSNVSLGATYLYANPLNGCGAASSHLDPTSGCFAKKAFPFRGTNPDDTLPGFELNTLYETYLQYKDPSLLVKIGNQVLNTPWANPSDSRLKPVAFEGGDLQYKFNKEFTGELAYFNRFQDRVMSDFVDATLLTFKPAAADGSGLPGNIISPGTITNNGFAYGRVGYSYNNLGANLHYYDFDKIANLIWLDGKYAWKTPFKPFVAIQYANERSTGDAVLGKIASDVYGVQGGVSFGPNVDVTLSYDNIPEKSDRVVLPAGASCATTGSAIHSIKATTTTVPYFLPTGGTPNCVPNGDGTTTIYYGGIATPYTDSYATDPLFTTTISQGMADRRSPGESGKLQATFTTNNKRLKFIAARALYRYGNNATGVAPTQETNLDGTYYFNAVPKTGAYHGLFFRYRYAERTINFTQLYGGLPIFKYNRAQLEFDF